MRSVNCWSMREIKHLWMCCIPNSAQIQTLHPFKVFMVSLMGTNWRTFCQAELPGMKVCVCISNSVKVCQDTEINAETVGLQSIAHTLTLQQRISWSLMTCRCLWFLCKACVPWDTARLLSIFVFDALLQKEWVTLNKTYFRH